MDPRRASDQALDDLLAEMGWLRALARRLARDGAAADDLAQGALVAALEHPPRPGRPLRPWLAAVVRNLARATRRSDGRRQLRERTAARSEPVPAEDEVLAQFEEQRRLAALVGRLDRTHRLVILRHFFRGESAAEIARDTGQPSATVRSHLARALARLRELHRIEHGGDERRARAALGLASASGTAAAPLAGALLAPLLAMKTIYKVAAVAAVSVLLLLGGREAVRLRAASTPDRGEAASPVLAEPTRAAEPAAPPAEAPADENARRAVEAPESAEEPAPAAAQRTALSLRAVDERGAPIRGARLLIADHDGMLRDMDPSEPSGPDGRIVLDVEREAMFRYAGNPEKLLGLHLVASGFATRFLVEEVIDEQVTELGERTLAPGGDVAGRVLDERGASAVGIEVVAKVEDNHGSTQRVYMGGDGPREGEHFLRATTDAEGRFAIAGLELRAHRLWFRRGQLNWNKTEPFELQAGERRTDFELTFPVLDPAELVHGRIVLPDGSPATSARIRWRRWSFWSDSKPALPDGSFAFQPGHEIGLIAEDANGDYSPSPMVSAKPGDPELILTLQPRRTCRIVVTDEEGAPIEDAWMMPFLGEDGVGDRWLHTDADGAHELLLPGEEFRLRVGCDGYEAVYVEALDPTALGEELAVVLPPAQGLYGVVLAGGEPLPGATVHLVQDLSEGTREVYKGFTSRFLDNGESAETDAEGRFMIAIDRDSTTPWTLIAEKPGYARAELAVGKVALGEEVRGLELRLTSGGTLEGLVLAPPGRTREGIVVACSHEDGLPLITRTDADGRYRFEHLTPGGWLVEAREETPEGRSISIIEAEEMPFVPNAQIVEGGSTVVDLDMLWLVDLSVDGRLVLDGVGAEGWTATAQAGHTTERGAVAETVEVDASGAFSAPAQRGPATLVLRSPEDAAVERIFERKVLVGRDTPSIELEFLTGGVRGSGLEPGAKLRVFQRFDDGAFCIHRFTADGLGAFEADGLPAGPGSLQRDTGRGWKTVSELAVEAGATATVE
ncbi:MAG: sigma-70 family RNA polymerase sigma factor [Planctomycetota bacterium]